MNQKCKVCGEPAAGFHFGAFTCEGCKSFFGRTYNNASSVPECKTGGHCSIDKKNRTVCKSCRLHKCLAVGMSKSGSRYGRRSNWFKVHCLIQEKMDVEFGTSSFGLYGSLDRDPLSPTHSGSYEKTPPRGGSPGSSASEDDKFVDGGSYPAYPNMINSNTDTSTINPNRLVSLERYQRRSSFSLYETDDLYERSVVAQEMPIDLSQKEASDSDQATLQPSMEMNCFEEETSVSYPLDLTVKTRTPIFINNGGMLSQ